MIEVEGSEEYEVDLIEARRSYSICSAHRAFAVAAIMLEVLESH